jgi:flagella basal body P-ring formation protein FlgA
MNLIRPLILLSWLALTSLEGACVTVSGDHIQAKDLAAADPTFATLKPAQEMALAPAPGARRVFPMTELARLAQRHNIIGWTPPGSVCFERALAPLSTEQVISAMRDALPEPGISLELIDFTRFAVPAGSIEFTRAALNPPSSAAPLIPVIWRGRLRYSRQNSVPVWAKVRVSVKRSTVVAAEALPVAKPIGREQVRVALADTFPFPDRPPVLIDDVAGRLPRRSIRPNQAVELTMLMVAPEVERGDTVSVEVSHGGAHLNFEGKAESSGHSGDSILVRNPETGKRFHAQVMRKGSVLIQAAEGQQR